MLDPGSARRHSGRGTIILLLTAAFGCGPTIDTTPLSGPYPPTPADAEILLYSTKLPECPYAEVSVLTGFQTSAITSLEDVLGALQERTRALGGDAIVGLRRIEKGGDSLSGYTGTAIRFTREGCRS